MSECEYLLAIARARAPESLVGLSISYRLEYQYLEPEREYQKLNHQYPELLLLKPECDHI